MSLIVNGVEVEEILYKNTANPNGIYLTRLEHSDGRLLWHKHLYDNEKTFPTCTQQGYTTHVCSVCNKTYIDDYVAEIPHDYKSAITKQPTCDEKGTTTFTCSMCAGSYLVDIASLGHSWPTAADEYRWSGYEACTAVRKCNNDAKHEDTLSGTITDAITTQPTCTSTGVRTYTATFPSNQTWAKKQTKTKTEPKKQHLYNSYVIPASCTEQGYTNYVCSSCANTYQDTYVTPLGHNWDANKYDWNVQKTACTATRTCKRDATHYEVSNSSKVVDEITANATCTTTGIKKHTATFPDSWATQTSTTTTIPAIGHTSTNYPTVAATCTATGLTGGTYCSICNAVLTNRTTVAALGHSFGGASYSWSTNSVGDYTACTASRTCTRDSNHKETSNATAVGAQVTTQPTCSATGTKVYTATFPVNWASTQTKSVSIPIVADNHKYGAVSYAWSGYTSCTASRTCAHNSNHKETAASTNITNKVTTAKTCTSDGVRTYTATFDKSWASNATKTEAIPAGHEWKAGVTVKPTCTTFGYTPYTCTVCGATKEENVVAATGHKYGTASYSWTGYTTCKATRTCSCGNAETVNATITNAVTTAATCTTTGTRTYTATFPSTASWASTKTKKETIAATGHSWNNPTYIWNGYNTCNATRTCKNDSLHYETATAREVDGQITSLVTTAPTVTTTGVRTYTARFDYNTASWAGSTTTTETISKLTMPSIRMTYMTATTNGPYQLYLTFSNANAYDITGSLKVTVDGVQKLSQNLTIGKSTSNGQPIYVKNLAGFASASATFTVSGQTASANVTGPGTGGGDTAEGDTAQT